MLVLKIVVMLAGAFCVFIAPLCLCMSFNEASKKKFGVEPLSLLAFAGVGIAAIVFWQGVIYYRDAVANHKDLSDPLALLGLGASGILATLFACVRATNVPYGIAATLILIAFGLILAPFMIIAILGGAMEGERTVVVRKRFWD